MANTIKWKAGAFLQQVRDHSGAQVGACYQCHKCSSGCPVAPDADFTTSQVMRLIQLGAEREVLECSAIWLCASCQACSTRCPMGIDIAGVMDTLRMLAVERDVSLATQRGEQFGRAFLGTVRRHGRAFELEMLLAYKLKSGTYWDDVDKARELLARHKLRLFPQRSGSVRQVRQVFARAKAEERQR